MVPLLRNAGVAGGGVLNNEGTLTVSNSTFSENMASEGGGIDNNFGPATLSNTIVANSPSGRNCGVDNPITEGGYNIDDDGSCVSAGISQTTDPLLDPNGLQNNGGPTQTIALLPTSPAIDAIPSQTNGCGEEIRTDQRGVRRPQGSGCDIGAFERRRFERTGGGGG